MRLALRAVAVGAVLLALLLTGGAAVVTAALPAMQDLFTVLVPELRPLAFGLDHERADRVVRVVVARERYIVIGSNVMEPHPQARANASTLVLQPLYGPLLALWLALAWPTRRPTWQGAAATLALRLSIAMPFALALAWVDTPVVLAASLWRLLVEHLAPGSFSPLLLANDVLNGGGRYAFGLGAGALSVGLAEALRQRLAPAR